ncbi:unnamed protein product [Larinioides sclopetarius]
MLEDASVFYRFAKARNFNLGAAEAMLRKHIAWRKELEVDTILTDYKPPELFLKYTSVAFVCFDKTGCAVLTHDVGRSDVKGVLQSAKKSECIKFSTYFNEQGKEQVIQHSGNGNKRFQLGKPIFYMIYDYEELTYSKAVSITNLHLFGIIVKTFLDNYPEYLKRAMVINAPVYFTWIYAALKPLLSAETIKKIRIYGADGWKEALLEDIDPDNLPAFLGGNRTDPDGNPLCETFIVRGKPVPKSYYLQTRKKKLALDSNVQKVIVVPFSKEEITLTVREENSYLEWEFETKNRDIDFSLLFKRESPEDMEDVVLIPKQRIDTNDEPEQGCFKCEEVGNYTFVFDNSYSWFHSKEIYYRAIINAPKNNEIDVST